MLNPRMHSTLRRRRVRCDVADAFRQVRAPVDKTGTFDKERPCSTDHIMAKIEVNSPVVCRDTTGKYRINAAAAVYNSAPGSAR